MAKFKYKWAIKMSRGKDEVYYYDSDRDGNILIIDNMSEAEYYAMENRLNGYISYKVRLPVKIKD